MNYPTSCETKVRTEPIDITLFRFAGSWGPFKVKIPCGECTFTEDVIQDCLDNELKGVPVNFQQYDWLSNWWKPLRRGGWHAPIVFVGKKMISQGIALNRGLLAQTVIEMAADSLPMKGNRVYGKNGCPHCERAKRTLADSNITVDYFDVVKEPTALYEMIAKVKPIVGEKTPITVPQIWLEGKYVGGADELEILLANSSDTQASQA
ncbi:MAG: glutaredoxin [Gammaproteobacteria bacterium]|nr:glutaredoxin [Gammaproteobacteria bacterium]